jgi:mannitol-1-phosphate 5-dehydrogenase
MKKKAVIYGGGNIGRGFIGQLFYESGYETAFIDINQELICQLNEKKEYPVKFTESSANSENGTEMIIKNIRGIDGVPENINEIANAIAEADIMAVSVGANILKFIMQPIASGINKRFADNNMQPLNIILCENLIGADKMMRDGVHGYITDDFKDLYDEKIGFIEASVGRMVPNQTDEMKAGNPLRIVTENYQYLPVDKDAFKSENGKNGGTGENDENHENGKVPEIKNMIAYAPFEYFVRRKLYIHNLGHAICAYLGDIMGYDYIWQAIQDPYIELITTKIMQRSALALSKIYDADMSDLNGYIESLIYRFENKALGDTVKRVGNDLKRKLAPNDRIVGAYKICVETGVPVHYLCLAIAVAVNFKSDKLSGNNVEDILKEAGSFDFLAENSDDFDTLGLIKKYDNIIKHRFTNIKDLFYIVKGDENMINSSII